MMDANDEMTDSEIAAMWFVRLKDGDLDEADRREYIAWLKKSPVHITLMLQTSHTFGKVSDALKGVPPEPQMSAQEADNIIKLATRAVVRPQPSQRFGRYRGKIAAVLTMVVVSSLLAMMLKSGLIDRRLETEANEWREVPLADGTMMHMGPRTRVTVKFGDSQRSVELLAGDAFFQVKKDPRRPFIVNAEPVDVRAVGTAFGVTRYGGRVEVTVREGIVEVSQSGRAQQLSGDGKQKTIGVSAGQQTLITPRTWPAAARAVDVDRELAWLQRHLSFDSKVDKVHNAVEEFNRRNKVQIVIADKVLDDRRLTGVFEANNPESLVAELVASAEKRQQPVVVIRSKPGVLRLEPRR